MPSIQNQYFYIKHLEAHARVQLPMNTNLGPGFVKIRRTGDVHRDYAKTKLGKFISHSDNPNLTIRNIRWKFYLITNRSINEDEKLTIDYTTIPWGNFSENIHIFEDKLTNYNKQKEISKMSISKEYIQNLMEQKVKIPVEKGDLGLSLDDPIESYKKQIEGGKKWDEMSQQINTLAIFNKNKNPEVAAKANKLRDSLADWIESKRKNNPDFAK